jgi:hypothetical protein
MEHRADIEQFAVEGQAFPLAGERTRVEWLKSSSDSVSLINSVTSLANWLSGTAV